MKIGFARVDVTPPLGTNMSGYFAPRTSSAVRDPLELVALALEVGEKRAVIVTGDFLSMYLPQAQGIRQEIAKETGIPTEFILLQALHQHTAVTAGITHANCPEYRGFLEQRYRDVVKLALADLAEATLATAEKETPEPVSFIRRFRMKDGSVATNPGFLNPDVDHPLGKADNTVRLVKICRDGARDIALVGFQTHPDTIGGNGFSADWPGFVRRMVEKDLNVHCILVNGCQGDTNHFNVAKPGIFNRELKYADCRRIGRIISDVAVSLWEKTEETEVATLSGEFDVLFFRTNIRGIENIEECKRLHALLRAGEPTPTPMSLAERGDTARIASLENAPVFQKVPVSMVAFGKIAVVGYGGEPFTEYADVLREAYPELFILTACNCNGSQGYLPSVAAFEEGGYEARSSRFSSDMPPAVQSAAKEMLKKHLES